MDIGESFSRLKKKLKYPGSKRKSDKTGADSDDKRVDPAGSFPQPAVRIAGGNDHDQGGNGTHSDRRQVHSTSRPPRLGEPQSVPTDGSKSDQEGGEADAGGWRSHLNPDVEVATGSGPSREGSDDDGESVERLSPFPSTSSILCGGDPNNTSTVPDVAEVLRPDESIKPSSTVDDNKLGWKSTASATAKLLLRGVRDSADAFGPLKSVAGGLCFILENCEKTKANKQAIESLAPRVKALAELFCTPVSTGDIREESRRKTLEWKLENIHQDLTPLAKQGGIMGFLANVETTQKINGLVEDIHEVMMEYQTSLQQDIYDKSCQLIESTDLTLLDKIHHTTDAGYLCGNRQGCLKGTRKEVLWEIECWLMGEQRQQVFWLNGLAGTGKSTIAQTFAEMAFADGKLGASFFCSRDFEDRSNLQAIFPTLAFQLAYQEPLFQKELLQVLKIHPDVRQESLCSQMEKLIVGPLKAANIPTLIVIDAIDECKDEEPASAILSILSRYVDKIPNVKFFITGRPEPRIRSGFRLESLLPITEVLKLHEVKPETVGNDIKLFFQTQLTELAKKRSDCNLAEDWPSSSEIEILCEKAAGFFIYASTVIRFVTSKNWLPNEQLNRITSIPQSTSHEGRSGIDILYTQVLRQAVDDVDVDDEELYSRFRTVVGAVLLVFNPLSVEALSDLLRVPNISTTLCSLHSLLLIPTSRITPIRIFHKSFPDFLMDQGRCTDHRFFIDPSVHHLKILLSCLNLMGERLKKNICRLDDYTFLSEVEDLSDHRNEYIGDALEYACCFWTKHLLKIPGTSPGINGMQEAIDKFFTTCLLYWIEVLSLMGKLNLGVYALNDIQQWYLLAGISCKWANDSQRLLLEWFDTICHSPSQVYHLALPFCPSSSWLHKHYSTELSHEVKVVKGLPAAWGTCSRTVMLDSYPLVLTCWKDTIAVSLHTGDIITLDGITGSQTAILSGHIDQVGSLAFSPDGTSLASGGYDKTIKLWDVQTGGVVKTFYGHTDWVISVSISADCTLIASGSAEKSIRLWDIQTEECHRVIEQQDCVFHVRFSPTDPQHLISVSGGEVWQWNTNGHQVNPTLDGSDVAFSLDGTQFVLCQGKDVILQSCDSGATVTNFHMANSTAYHCCFSPDGRLIAVAANRIAYVWNTTSSDPHPMLTLVGHSDNITSLSFSSPSSLISLSDDRSVKFWQIGVLATDPAVTDPESTPFAPASVTSITLQTKDGIAISSHSDGMVRTWDVSTGCCRTSCQTPARNPRWSNTRQIHGRLIYVWFVEWKFHIWDAARVGPHHIEVDWGNIEDVRLSGDGFKILCLHWEAIRAWSIPTGEVVGSASIECSQPQAQRSLSVDGSRVWVHSTLSSPQGWDFGILGSSPVRLSSTSLFHPNDTKLWDVGQSRIKDMVTEKTVFQLAGRFAKPIDTQWDGQYLVAGYKSGEVLILDFGHILPSRDS